MTQALAEEGLVDVLFHTDWQRCRAFDDVMCDQEGWGLRPAWIRDSGEVAADMSQVVAADRFQNIQMLCKDHPSELPLDHVAMSDCKISRRDIQLYVLVWRRWIRKHFPTTLNRNSSKAVGGHPTSCKPVEIVDLEHCDIFGSHSLEQKWENVCEL